MRTYIALCGQRNWALVNSLWASIEEHGYLPEKLIMLCHARLKHDAESCAAPARELIRSYGIEPEVSIQVVSEAHFVTRDAQKVEAIIAEEKAEGNEVALDNHAREEGSCDPRLLGGPQARCRPRVLSIPARHEARKPAVSHDTLCPARLEGLRGGGG